MTISHRVRETGVENERESKNKLKQQQIEKERQQRKYVCADVNTQK